MEDIIWKLGTGMPWRNIYEESCSWKTAYNSFNYRSKSGLLEKFL